MASGLDQPLIAFDTNTLIAQTALPSSFITAPDIHTALVTGVSQIGHGALGVVDATVDAAVGTVGMLGNLSLAALNDQTQGYLGSKFEMFRNADRTRSQLQQGIATTIANPQGAMTSMFEHLAERERQAQWHEANGNPAAAARIRGGYASSIASGAMGGAGVVRGIARYSDVVAGGGRVATNRGASDFVGPLIGKSGFKTSAEFAESVGARYQGFVDNAYVAAQRLEAKGLLRGNPNTRVGDYVDRISSRDLKGYLASEGITEGPNSLVQMNRWLRDPAGTGLYVRPDVHVPSAGRIYDATVGFKAYNSTQIQRFGQYSGGNYITVVRPGPVGGSYSIVP
jgi:hypothetical protein